MTWQDLIESTAQRYAELAQQPGWFQHCKQQVIAMEAEMAGHCWPGTAGRAYASAGGKS